MEKQSRDQTDEEMDLVNIVESRDPETEDEREHWSNKLDSMMSLVGYCVGLGNIWRFPYFCMRNGGGSFLIAFLFFLVVCGMPMYFLDMAIGQFTGKTAFHAWEVCPLLKGIGVGVILVDVIISTYYTVIIVWDLYYLGNSFFNPLPWSTCGNDWNTNQCITDRSTFGIMNESITGNISVSVPVLLENYSAVPNILTNYFNSTRKSVMSVEEFWQRSVLQLSPGIGEIGFLPWHMAVCFLLGWIIIFLSLVRGIKSSGKVVYITASLPYILLTVILVRAAMLPGSGQGIIYYLTPDLERLKGMQVWLEAALQVFYSLCPAWGPIITLASYNKFSNNCYRDSIILTFICEGTSIYGGFVVFAVLGFMSHETGVHISKVVTSGPGLVFMSYPEALSKLPVSNLWSVFFFLMVLSVGLDSQFSHMETLVAALLDQFPVLRKRRIVVHATICLTWYLFGLLMCTQGGMYVFLLMDWYIAISIPVFGLIECIIVGWIYGAERFSRDVNLMIGHSIPVFMRILLCLVVPVILLFITIFAFGTYALPSYGDYQYPSYAVAIGLCIGSMPLVPVIILAFKAVRNAHGSTFFERLVNASKPSVNWKPASREHARSYEYDELLQYKTFWSRVKLNLFGQNNNN